LTGVEPCRVVHELLA